MNEWNYLSTYWALAGNIIWQYIWLSVLKKSNNLFLVKFPKILLYHNLNSALDIMCVIGKMNINYSLVLKSSKKFVKINSNLPQFNAFQDFLR